MNVYFNFSHSMSFAYLNLVYKQWIIYNLNKAFSVLGGWLVH